MKKFQRVLGFASLASLSSLGVFAALVVAGCGGQAATEDDGTEVNDARTRQAISSPQPSDTSDTSTPPGPSAGDDGARDDGAGDDHERADKDDDRDRGDDHADCNEDETEKHHHHRHHRFHVLDTLDGTRDRQITIASLPASLPARLIARLHEIDTNGDGIVTKDEAKAWEHAHKHDRGMKRH